MVSIGLAAALALAGTADGEESWRMSSLRQDGSSVWVLRVNTGDLATTPLTAPTWFPPFPANSISLASGAQWSIGQARGSVVVVTFWASWCVPCHEELPALDRLYRAEHARGFEVIGINVNEQMRIALEAAEKMNLGFPIALLSREMGSALGIDKLPTTLIVDRAGGIRARWNSFGPGLEATIAAQIRQIMNEPSERPARELAGVVTGGTSISGVWNRDLALEATSAAIASSREGRRILVAAGKELQELRADGEMGKRSAVSSSIGYLRSGDVDADGDTEIVEFRAGAPGSGSSAGPARRSVCWRRLLRCSICKWWREAHRKAPAFSLSRPWPARDSCAPATAGSSCSWRTERHAASHLRGPRAQSRWPR
jgi:thiol-disulfide isomerase/thioredoxin